ncbi:MAG: carbohydrate ABC transporter permease [Chloroflexi bacterium]|uniref:Carbohydrate ABC transporter permease n=1 Tax=Candidatus Chlorohelix allophototropha TaxID=3003348 RepID=A0A8T7M4W2_9CHLR|nr:carbohydrate ABC transporter permease [Chloroflexota bacterium]WJW69056.1 carbohydrate ABC transporter permease [Chloroflexota bacterium L227-S17]
MFEKMTWRRQLSTQLMLAFASLFVVLPVLWMLRLAFDGTLSGISSGTGRPKDSGLVPVQWSTENFQLAWNSPTTSTTLLGLLGNSLIVAGGTALLSLVCGITAGYAFARYSFPGRKPALFMTLVLLTLPPAGLTAPFFIFLNDLKIRDSLLSLILVYSAIAVPFAIWTVRNAIQVVPPELEEAAMLEGGGITRVFRSITLPLILPSVAVAGFISFTLAWSEFALGWVFISTPHNVTLAMALYAMRGASGVAWGPLAATALIVILPVLALFYLLGRYVISGLTLGTATIEE